MRDPGEIAAWALVLAEERRVQIGEVDVDQQAVQLLVPTPLIDPCTLKATVSL